MNLNRYPKFTLKDYNILPAFVMFEAIASCWMRTGIQFPADWQHLGKHVFSYFFPVWNTSWPWFHCWATSIIKTDCQVDWCLCLAFCFHGTHCMQHRVISCRDWVDNLQSIHSRNSLHKFLFGAKKGAVFVQPDFPTTGGLTASLGSLTNLTWGSAAHGFVFRARRLALRYALVVLLNVGFSQ